jgi:hypothetical protein
MKTEIILGIIVIGLFVLYKNQKPGCNSKVELVDGEIYFTRRINYYQSGVADMQLCDGKHKVIQTDLIDTIKYLK